MFVEYFLEEIIVKCADKLVYMEFDVGRQKSVASCACAAIIIIVLIA